jgi:hypothetical protein
MKERPPPEPTDDRTPFERMVDLTRRIVRVPKEEIERRDRAQKRKRKRIPR